MPQQILWQPSKIDSDRPHLALRDEMKPPTSRNLNNQFMMSKFSISNKEEEEVNQDQSKSLESLSLKPNMIQIELKPEVDT